MLTLFILLFSTVVVGIHLLSIQYLPISEDGLFFLRILSVLFLSYYGWVKKSLPTWILISMLIGIVIGYDFPQVAVKLDVLSKVFLKLIKTIIAPLIFATLVVGIAGHSNLKQVGRIAWKSILYFYFATTFALFIGLLAINFTKAGSGIAEPTDMGEALQKPAQQTW